MKYFKYYIYKNKQSNKKVVFTTQQRFILQVFLILA